MSPLQQFYERLSRDALLPEHSCAKKAQAPHFYLFVSDAVLMERRTLKSSLSKKIIHSKPSLFSRNAAHTATK